MAPLGLAILAIWLGISSPARATPRPLSAAELAAVGLAAEYLAEQLAKAPSLSLLLHCIELNADLPKGQSAWFLDSLRPHIQHLLDEKPLYQCGHCGFEARMLHWQCPSCRYWSSIKRKAGNGAEA